MTISGVFLSVFSGPRPYPPAEAAEREELHLCQAYRAALPMSDIALPSSALRNHVLAEWVHDERLTVDVRSGDELELAVAVGIHPGRMTLHADGLHESELRAAIALGPGRIVVSSMGQLHVLAPAVGRRTQGVVVRVTDVNPAAPAVAGEEDSVARNFRFDSVELATAISWISAMVRLNLVGLHCDVGSNDHDFVSYPAAIGDMITEMASIRRHHGVVLNRVGLGGGRAVPSGDWSVELPDLAAQIDQSVDDACATLRHPRPLVVLSPGQAIVGRIAA